MFCLTLEPNHYEFIKKLGYLPVGLGEKNFGNDWFSDKSGENINLTQLVTLNPPGKKVWQEINLRIHMILKDVWEASEEVQKNLKKIYLKEIM